LLHLLKRWSLLKIRGGSPIFLSRSWRDVEENGTALWHQPDADIALLTTPPIKRVRKLSHDSSLRVRGKFSGSVPSRASQEILLETSFQVGFERRGLGLLEKMLALLSFR
jgi:hypothetical protein